MTVVKSPYNFVPAPEEDEVFYPDWADQVSQDIPFSDGESGEIEFKITAETPIFIRNGHSEQDQEIFENYKNGDLSKASKEEKEAYERYISFSNLNGKYFIPATSLKGMIRNVVEIISNSKLSQLDDHRHAVRQIMKRKDDVMDEDYELSVDNVKKHIKCGYLIKRGNQFYIHSCGQPLKIRYTDLDEKYSRDFEGQFGANDEANISKKFDHRTAAYKYDLLAGKELETEFEIHPLNETEKQKSWVSQFQPLRYVRFASEFPEDDTFPGRIVLVGQSSNYNVSTSRKGEYVFRGKKTDILSDNHNQIEVPKKKIKDFKFINRDGKGKNIELKDWAYWKGKMKEGIPVFFREKEENGQKKIIDFGLPFMYKQPANHRVKDLLPDYSDKKDLAELIFGNAVKDNALKGRVSFGNAKCTEENPSISDEVIVTLSSPKSSFTPNYLLQENGKNGKTTQFNTYNTGGRLRGFKKYPVKSRTIEHQGESEKMQSHFKPLARGSGFKAKVRFHNLRPIEIGAIVNAITLHQTKETYHNIGYAKPLGYGLIKVSGLKSANLKNRLEDYAQKFEVEMRARFGPAWNKRIEELLTMSGIQNKDVERSLKYNDLDEYQAIKNEGLYLQPYSEIAQEFVLKNSYSAETENRFKEINKGKLEQEQRIKELKEAFTTFKNEKDYKKAISKLKELNQLQSVGNFDEEIDNISSLKAEQDEKKFIEYLIREGNLEELKTFKEKNEFHSRIDEINQRLNKLKPSTYPKRYREIDIRLLLKEIPRAIKKKKINPKEFPEELYEDFKRALSEAFKKKKVKEKWQDFNGEQTWIKVINILGEERARKLYRELFEDQK